MTTHGIPLGSLKDIDAILPTKDEFFKKGINPVNHSNFLRAQSNLTGEGDKLSCPICLETLTCAPAGEESDIVQLTWCFYCTPTSHMGHGSCFREWLSDNRTCPICRDILYKSSPSVTQIGVIIDPETMEHTDVMMVWHESPEFDATDSDVMMV
jgi:hypothetical protein